MGSSHKRGWSHLKLNINDWVIPFPKILRIYQWIGFNEFENVHSKLQIFDMHYLVHPCSFYLEEAYGFLNKNWLFFWKLNIKDSNVFYTDIYYIYDNNSWSWVIYKKKVLKNVSAFLINLSATTKQLIRTNSIGCLKNQAICFTGWA